MLTYFISQSTGFTVRTEVTRSSDLTLELEDTYLGTTSSINLSGSYSFTPYENILAFTASLTGAIEGTEYLATINDISGSIWRGSIQVFSSQSVDKPTYETQRNDYSSSISQNQYIIL